MGWEAYCVLEYIAARDVACHLRRRLLVVTMAPRLLGTTEVRGLQVQLVRVVAQAAVCLDREPSQIFLVSAHCLGLQR